MAFRTNKMPAIEERTVSGSSVSFHSNFALPLKACKVSFSATESGTGEKSPSNPYTISGVSSLNLSANSVPVSVNFGDTYYGGELDLIRKKAIIEYGLKTYKGNELWSETSTAYYLSNSDMKVGTRMMDGIANWLKTLPAIGMGIMFGSNNRAMYIGKEVNSVIGVSDVTGFKNYMSNHNLEVVYPLANPIEIDLSSIPDLSSILGNNTFSTDTGTLEITFSDLQEKSASGSVATFNTALAMPLVNGEFTIEAYQEGSGDPSPVNLRNIVPFSEIKVSNTDNYIPNTTITNGYIANDGSITSSSAYRCPDYIEIPNGVTSLIERCRVPITTGTKLYRIAFYTSNQEFIELGVSVQSKGGVLTFTCDIPENAKYIRACIGSGYDVWLLGSGNLYTINLGEDMCGGSYNSASGVKRKTWGYADLGDFNWVAESDNIFRTSANTPTGAKSNGLIICDSFVYSQYSAGANRPNYSINLNSYFGPNKISVKDSDYSTPEDFKIAVTGVKVAYELAEPIETNIGSTPISTNIGNNSIFADTGDVDLTFKDLDIAKRGNFREVFKLPS